MKRIKAVAALVLLASVLSACSGNEGVGTKMEKKNIVKDTLEKRIEEAKPEDGKEDVKQEGENETSVNKASVEKEIEEEDKKVEKPKKNSKTSSFQAQERQNQKVTEKTEEKRVEEKTIDEQIDKLTEGEKGETSAKESPDYNPTDEGGAIGSNSYFFSQFGEDEFDKMMNEARNVKKNGEFDYDLTIMSGDMIYATVFMMMSDPDFFQDKKVKMRGQYYAAFYEPSGLYYHYCFISDAAGCCQQGIEFAVDKKFKYPDDFPQDGEDILVTGTFEKYFEDGRIFIRLKDATMTAENQNKKN